MSLLSFPINLKEKTLRKPFLGRKKPLGIKNIRMEKKGFIFLSATN